MKTTIAFDCPSCNKAFESEFLRDGQEFDCTKCAFNFTILSRTVALNDPATPGALINFHCSHCDQILEAESQARGLEINCPKCNREMQVPLRAIAEPLPTVLTSSPVPSSPSGFRQRLSFIATTGNEVSGYKIQTYLGIARGVVVRTPKAGQSILGGLEQLLGGNNEAYASVCDQARRDAFEKMTLHAAEMDADAVIAFRYDATEFAPGITEVLAYGTAVKLTEAKLD